MKSVSLLEGISKKTFRTDQAFRNIPTNYPSRHLYGEDLTPKEIEVVQFWADFGAGINQELSQKDRWYDYHDLENLNFCFEGLNIPNSRYSDGSFPVWYGTLGNEVASRAEVLYHLIRQARIDFSESEEYICFQRAMCRAKVYSKDLGDLELFLQVNPVFHDDPPYRQANQIGLEAVTSGFSALIFPSKRYSGANCIAVFDRECIQESRVINFFSVEVYRERVTICHEPVDFPMEGIF